MEVEMLEGGSDAAVPDYVCVKNEWAEWEGLPMTPLDHLLDRRCLAKGKSVPVIFIFTPVLLVYLLS